jgi:poly-gamma-glutamate synthesis protein (capsule biosynthesis protein)
MQSLKKAIFLLGLLALIAFFLFLIFPNEKNIKTEVVIKEKTEEIIPEKVIEEKELSKEIRIIFAGDLMLDRYYRLLIQKNGVDSIMEKSKSVFDNQDLAIVNLEGPITDKKSVSAGPNWSDPNSFVFTFDPKTAEDFLKNNRINLVSIGNNHIMNFGQEGLLQTEAILERNNIGYFGNPNDNSKKYVKKEINGQEIIFINYNQFSNRSAEKIAEEIKNLKTIDNFVIVYTHWGEEYRLKADNEQKRKAHLFVDNGANLIIGTHPHVVEPVEIYKNKAIFYSLGNFVFDQFFSEDTKNGLAVGIIISENKQEFNLVPFYNNKGQIVLADEAKKKVLLERLAKDSEVEENIKIGIKNGKFVIIN